MNDEIKEILRDLEFASGVFDYTITPDRCTFLKNYIINLQEKYKKSCETYQKLVEELTEENENLKDKINKALNYMKNNKIGSYIELYKILGGNLMDLFKENK